MGGVSISELVDPIRRANVMDTLYMSEKVSVPVFPMEKIKTKKPAFWQTLCFKIMINS